MIKLKEIISEQYEYSELFLTGGCVDFCFALHDILGYNMFGIMINYEEYKNGEIIHCFGLTNDESIGVDIKGKRNIDYIFDDFEEVCEEPYYVRLTIEGFNKKLKETKFPRNEEYYSEAVQIINDNISLFK